MWCRIVQTIRYSANSNDIDGMRKMKNRAIRRGKYRLGEDEAGMENKDVMKIISIRKRWYVECHYGKEVQKWFLMVYLILGCIKEGMYVISHARTYTHHWDPIPRPDFGVPHYAGSAMFGLSANACGMVSHGLKFPWMYKENYCTWSDMNAHTRTIETPSQDVEECRNLHRTVLNVSNHRCG